MTSQNPNGYWLQKSDSQAPKLRGAKSDVQAQAGRFFVWVLAGKSCGGGNGGMISPSRRSFFSWSPKIRRFYFRIFNPMKTFIQFCLRHSRVGSLRILTVATLLVAVATTCGAQQTVTVTAPAATPYTNVSAGPDWTVWQSTNYELLPSGQIIPHIQSYEERATGLNFLNPATHLYA